MNMGEKIKEFRKDHKLTQAQLAAKLGVSASALQKYENGQTEITISILEKIAVALGINIVNFFEDETADISALIKRRLNVNDNSSAQLDYDFKLLMQFLKFKYRS